MVKLIRLRNFVLLFSVSITSLLFSCQQELGSDLMAIAENQNSASALKCRPWGNYESSKGRSIEIVDGSGNVVREERGYALMEGFACAEEGATYYWGFEDWGYNDEGLITLYTLDGKIITQHFQYGLRNPRFFPQQKWVFQAVATANDFIIRVHTPIRGLSTRHNPYPLYEYRKILKHYSFKDRNWKDHKAVEYVSGDYWGWNKETNSIAQDRLSANSDGIGASRSLIVFEKTNFNKINVVYLEIGRHEEFQSGEKAFFTERSGDDLLISVGYDIYWNREWDRTLWGKYVGKKRLVDFYKNGFGKVIKIHEYDSFEKVED